MMQNRSHAFLVEIDGKPLADCIAKIQKVLLRHSSPGLAAGLRKYVPRLGELAGRNYMQSLAWLKAPRTD